MSLMSSFVDGEVSGPCQCLLSLYDSMSVPLGVVGDCCCTWSHRMRQRLLISFDAPGVFCGPGLDRVEATRRERRTRRARRATVQLVLVRLLLEKTADVNAEGGYMAMHSISGQSLLGRDS